MREMGDAVSDADLDGGARLEQRLEPEKSLGVLAPAQPPLQPAQHAPEQPLAVFRAVAGLGEEVDQTLRGSRIDALCRSRRPAERGAEEGRAEDQLYIGDAFILNSWEAQRRMRIAGAERLDELSSYN